MAWDFAEHQQVSSIPLCHDCRPFEGHFQSIISPCTPCEALLASRDRHWVIKEALSAVVRKLAKLVMSVKTRLRMVVPIQRHGICHPVPAAYHQLTGQVAKPGLRLCSQAAGVIPAGSCHPCLGRTLPGRLVRHDSFSESACHNAHPS
jgi:hypothetical protein